MPTSSPHDRDLTIAERHDGDWLVLDVEGDLDIASSATLAIEVRDLVRRGTGTLCIDLTNVGFVDTSGIASLLNAERSLSRVDGRFAVLAPDGSAAHVLLERMGKRGLLTLASTPAELAAPRA